MTYNNAAQGATEVSARAPRSPGRPRSDAARRSVLDAAYAILQETDLGGFSIEKVAMRSNVSRPTIYRWWPSKSVLAIDSFLEAFRPQLAYARSGDSAADLHALVASLVRALERVGGPGRGLGTSPVRSGNSGFIP